MRITMLGVLCLLSLYSATVFAHAELTRSSPKAQARLLESPKLVELWFTEELRPNFTAITVTDTQGKRVDRGAVTLSEGGKKAQIELGDLAPGIYAVVWKAVSIDDHTIRGKITFTVTGTSGAGQPTGSAGSKNPPAISSPQESGEMPVDGEQSSETPITWVDSVVRWISYLAMMTLFGGFAFYLHVMMPALSAVYGKGNAGSESATAVSARRTSLLLWAAVAVLLLTSVIALVFQAAAVFDKPLKDALAPALLMQVIRQTDFGASWLLEVLAVAVLLVIVFLLSNQIKRQPSSSHASLWWLGLGASALLLAAPSWTGHAAASAKDYRLAIVTDWLHLIAGGFWVGGLFHLALSGLPALRYVERGERIQLIGQLISKFTRVAVPSVVLLGLAGLYNTWMHVGSLAGLWDTRYGQTLLWKLALVAFMFVLGAVNNFHFGKMVARLGTIGAATSDTEAAKLERGFKRSVALEAGLGVLVLLVTAALVFITPARNHPAMQTEASPSGATSRR